MSNKYKCKKCNSDLMYWNVSSILSMFNIQSTEGTVLDVDFESADSSELIAEGFICPKCNTKYEINEDDTVGGEKNYDI